LIPQQAVPRLFEKLALWWRQLGTTQKSNESKLLSEMVRCSATPHPDAACRHPRGQFCPRPGFELMIQTTPSGDPAQSFGSTRRGIIATNC
jgi:hypothetical protein